MAENARTTRLVALMAANGLVMSKNFDLYTDYMKSAGLVHNPLAAALGLIALVGVITAYGGLIPAVQKVGGHSLELISAGMFFISIWLWILLAHLDIGPVGR
jgi:hypothetical protein